MNGFNVLNFLFCVLFWGLGYAFCYFSSSKGTVMTGIEVTKMGHFRYCEDCCWTPDPNWNEQDGDVYTGCVCKKCGGELKRGYGRAVYRFFDKNRLAEGAPQYEVTYARFYKDGIVSLDEFPDLVLVSPEQVVCGATQSKEE